MAVSSLSVSVAHAVSFLTRPLVAKYSAQIVGRLQLVLEANLTAHYAPTWVPSEPTRGCGRRCITLSPDCLPPRVIYAACLATNVQWFDWFALLGGVEFDLCVDPGRVYIKFGKGNQPQTITVWADEAPVAASIRRQPHLTVKTFAQQLMEDDHEEDERLFSMLADEIRAPTWMTPVVDRFPISCRSASPLSTISNDSTHSRSSSRSSNSSGSFSSSSSASTKNDEKKLSRRERARQARVYIDTSKIDVTPYDGGKTTVLTGGVMLGKKTTPSTNSWRAA